MPLLSRGGGPVLEREGLREQVGDGRPQLRYRNRLVEKHIGARILRAAVHSVIGVPADHQNRRIFRTRIGSQAFDQIDPRNSREHEIANNDVERLGRFDGLQSALRIRPSHDFVRTALENRFDQGANCRIVVGYKDARKGLGHQPTFRPLARPASHLDCGKRKDCEMKTFKSGRAVFPIAAVILVATMAAPVIATFAAVPPAAVRDAFTAPDSLEAGRVSLVAAALAVAIASVLGVPAGYALARSRGAGRALALFVLALPLAFPPVASGIMLLQVVGGDAPLGALLASHGIRFVDTIGGVALAEFFVAGSFVAIASTAAFASLDPIYDASARTLGAGDARIFWRVALPLAAPNIGAGILLAWMRALGEYGATSVVAYRPESLPIALYTTLSAQGIKASLALAYGFILLAAIVVGLQWAVRRRVV
jgi:molybdate/tungstate transport system permease protein